MRLREEVLAFRTARQWETDEGRSLLLRINAVMNDTAELGLDYIVRRFYRFYS